VEEVKQPRGRLPHVAVGREDPDRGEPVLGYVTEREVACPTPLLLSDLLRPRDPKRRGRCVVGRELSRCGRPVYRTRELHRAYDRLDLLDGHGTQPQDYHPLVQHGHDGGLDPVGSPARVEDEVDALAEVPRHVLGPRGAQPAEGVRAGCGDRDACAPDQL